MDLREHLDRDGYILLERVYAAGDVRDAIERLTDCLQRLSPSSASVRSREGRVYALRNLLELFPDAKQVWNRRPLADLLREVLGDEAGLVRGLFFDKPPERSWSLPWHKDLTIALQRDVKSRHRAASTGDPLGVRGKPRTAGWIRVALLSADQRSADRRRRGAPVQ